MGALHGCPLLAHTSSSPSAPAGCTSCRPAHATQSCLRTMTSSSMSTPARHQQSSRLHARVLHARAVLRAQPGKLARRKNSARTQRRKRPPQQQPSPPRLPRRAAPSHAARRTTSARAVAFGAPLPLQGACSAVVLHRLSSLHLPRVQSFILHNAGMQRAFRGSSTDEQQASACESQSQKSNNEAIARAR